MKQLTTILWAMEDIMKDCKHDNEKVKKIKSFIKNHKIEIATGALIVAEGVVIGFLLKKNKNLKISLNYLKEDNIRKDKLNESLRYLCKQKDIRHAEAISDGTRHGSPVCAQDLVGLREYYKTHPQA